jgi:hypothetical protein
MRVISIIALVSCGVGLLMGEEAWPWLNGWLRAGLAVGFLSAALSRANFGLLPPPNRKSELTDRIALFFFRSMQVSFVGYTLAALLIAVGLLVKNTAGGYIGAYLAFALVWVLGWLVRLLLKAGEPTKRLVSGHPPPPD